MTSTPKAQGIAYQVHPTIEEVDEEVRGWTDAKLKQHADKFDSAQIAHLQWTNWPEAQRYATRAGNELARRETEAERKAKEAEREREREAAEQERIEAMIAEYKKRAQGAFPGSLAEFEKEWPELKRRWQIAQTERKLAEQYGGIGAHGVF